MQTFETLLCEAPQPDILVVRFNRPEAANALNTQMAHDVHALFGATLQEPRAIRCVILTGAGEKAFCAGGDLKERNGMTDAAWREQHIVFEHAFYAVMDCPVPVIAAVNGAAYGGGCEFALACDFVYAAENARFALTETKLGIIPGGGGTQNLARAVGSRRAKELIFSATPFTAQEALEWGMVNRVLPAQDLFPQAMEAARRIALNAPVAVRQAKRAIDGGVDLARKAGLALEIEAYNETVTTQDRREGVLAFNEKRAPRFTGR